MLSFIILIPGRCVGRANQRFFICFAFYACLGSFIGVQNLIEVMNYYRNWASSDIFYYLLPFTTVAYFANYGAVQRFELLYVSLIGKISNTPCLLAHILHYNVPSILDFGIGAFLFTGFLVIIGFKSVLSGNTPREAKVIGKFGLFKIQICYICILTDFREKS